MTNPIHEVETVTVNVAKRIAVGVEDVVHVGSDIYKVLSDAKALEPEFKAELSTLLTDCGPIVTAMSPVIAGGGTNVAADLAAIAPVLSDIKKLVTDFTAFLPTLKAAVGEIKTDATA
jgi:phage-related minor tail protein